MVLFKFWSLCNCYIIPDGNNLKVDSDLSYTRATSGENLFSAELNNGKITIV